MNDEETIELMAREICNNRLGCVVEFNPSPFDKISDVGRDCFRQDASAAIAAIEAAGFVIVPREATKAMHDAGNAADCHSGECGSYAIWPAMIDAALKEPKPS